MQSQVHLVYALTAIHNYIGREAGLEALETGLGTEELEPEINEDQGATREGSTSTGMDRLREKMAERMWEHYVDLVFEK